MDRTPSSSQSQSAPSSRRRDAIEAGSADTADALRNQMRTPLAMAVMLPAGLKGLLCAAMLAAFISTHDTYLHSWGSIFVQDVAIPVRSRHDVVGFGPWSVKAGVPHVRPPASVLEATPAQRLAWLEEALALAWRAGALPRLPGKASR